MSKIIALRYHDISCGHRVYGHESKCAHLHGHNYRIHFFIEPNKELDDLGRVLDFSVIKSSLCEWLERNWDHRFLVYLLDPLAKLLFDLDPNGTAVVAFNPTAENMAKFLVEQIGPILLKDKDCKLVRVQVDETRKCSAIYEI